MSSKKKLGLIPVACAMRLKITYVMKNGDGVTSKHSDQKRDGLPFYTSQKNTKMAELFRDRVGKDAAADYYYSIGLVTELPRVRSEDSVTEKIIYKISDNFKKASFSLEFRPDLLQTEEKKKIYGTLPGIFYKARTFTNEHGREFIMVVIAINKKHIQAELWGGNLSQRYSILLGDESRRQVLRGFEKRPTAAVGCMFQGCGLPISSACKCGKAFYCSSQHRALHFKGSHQNACSFYSCGDNNNNNKKWVV